MLRYRRLDRIITSNEIHYAYLDSEKAMASSRATWRGNALVSTAHVRGMWSTRLSESVDGCGLKEASKVKSAHQFIGDGTRLLTGRDFIHIVQSGRFETTNHISQTCRAAKKSRIDRHNIIVAFRMNLGSASWDQPI